MLMVMDDALIERLIDRLTALQAEENYNLKILGQQLAETEKGIENMLTAIQAGIITPSTKERLMALKARKAELEESILKEQISFFLYQFRTINTNDEDERQRLIDSFVNAVYVFNDKIILTCNYRDGTKTIKLSDLNSSDLGGFGPPKASLRAARL